MNKKPMKIVEHIKVKGMYRLEWKNGILSEDFYNLTRANDILQNYEEYVKYMNMQGNDRWKGLDLMC